MSRKTNILTITVMVIMTLSLLACQKSFFVSAEGSNDNNGKSESKPFKTLEKAFQSALESNIKTITVIGVLDMVSEGTAEESPAVFELRGVEASKEILITGKSGNNLKNEAERAVLSAKDSGISVITLAQSKIRFEHIEISGAEGETGKGIQVIDGAELSLGTGAVVQDNVGSGVSVITYRWRNEARVQSLIQNNAGGGVDVAEGSSFILDGGAITANNGIGVFIRGGAFTMSSGSISGNNVSGVYMQSGTFSMSGGSITNTVSTITDAGYGSGVHLTSNSEFTMTGGTISDNTSCGVRVVASTFTLYDGSISGNKSSGEEILYYSGGGGVFVSGAGNFTMSGGSISGNTAERGGGGVYVQGGNFTMSGGSISGNSDLNGGLNGGGGVYMQGGNFTMSGGSISGNSALNGGGVLVTSRFYSHQVPADDGVFELTGGSITGNNASRDGGGVYVMIDYGPAVFNMTDGSITGNTAERRGGGVWSRRWSDRGFNYEGGTVSDNTAPQDADISR